MMRRLFLMMFVFASCSALFLVTPVLAQNAAKTEKQDTKKEKDDSDDLINPDRPGIADGSNVVGKNRFQIETGVQMEFRKDAGVREESLFIPTLLRYGINKDWEFRVEGNTFSHVHVFDPAIGPSNADGYAPFSVGFKYHWQDGKGPGVPSLGTIFRLFLPTGSGAFSSHRFTGDWRLAADMDLTKSGDWSLNPNIGIGYYEDDAGHTFLAGLAAVTLGYSSKDKRFNPFIDFGLQTPESKDGKTALIIDAGIAYIVTPDFQLDVSIGQGISGRTSPHPFWSAGISIRF